MRIKEWTLWFLFQDDRTPMQAPWPILHEMFFHNQRHGHLWATQVSDGLLPLSAWFQSLPHAPLFLFQLFKAPCSSSDFHDPTVLTNLSQNYTESCDLALESRCGPLLQLSGLLLCSMGPLFSLSSLERRQDEESVAMLHLECRISQDHSFPMRIV